MVDPFNPKLTPLEAEKTIWETLLLLFDADTLIELPAAAVATLAKMMPPALVPNVTLFAFVKLRVWNANEPLLALAAWAL